MHFKHVNQKLLPTAIHNRLLNAYTTSSTTRRNENRKRKKPSSHWIRRNSAIARHKTDCIRAVTSNTFSGGSLLFNGFCTRYAFVCKTKRFAKQTPANGGVGVWMGNLFHAIYKWFNSQWMWQNVSFDFRRWPIFT